MKDPQIFISIEEYLEKNNIHHNPILVNSIKKYLDSKIKGDGLSNVGLKDNSEYLINFFDTGHVKKKLTKLIQSNQILTKKYTL